MAFDLKAATEAARTEAAQTPFQFKWGRESFTLRPVAEWPIAISVGFAEMAENPDDPANNTRLIGLLREVVGDKDWDRFAHTVPMDAFTILMQKLSQVQVGTPDLSPSAEPVLTPT